MYFGIIFDVCLILFRSRARPAKRSKTFVFTMNLYDSTIQKNMVSNDFQDLFRYQIGHRLLIALGSILAPFGKPDGINFHDFG